MSRDRETMSSVINNIRTKSRQEFCRICLMSNSENLVSLFDESGSYALQLPEKIMSISDILIGPKEDGLTDKICKKCALLVDTLYCFKREIESADRRIRQLRNSSNWQYRDEEVNKKNASDVLKHDDLDYEIEWISQEVKRAVENAFGRKHRSCRAISGNTCKVLKKLGVVVELFPIDRNGREIIKNEEEAAVESGGAGDDKNKAMVISSESSPANNRATSPNKPKVRLGKRRRSEERKISIGTTSKTPKTPKRRQRAIPPTGATVASEKDSNKNIKQVTSIKRMNYHAIKPKPAEPREFFQCTSCNVNLSTVADVLLHHNQIHTPNKASLCCRMCDKTFAVRSDLLIHFGRHMEKHLVRCPYCPKEFILGTNLEQHVNGEHGTTIDKSGAKIDD